MKEKPTIIADESGLQHEKTITITEPPESSMWEHFVPSVILEGSYGLKVEVIRADRDLRELVVRDLS